MKAHMFIFGNVRLQREYCWKCRRTSLVDDGIFQCCNKPWNNSDFNGANFKHVCPSGSKKKRISMRLKKTLLLLQKNRCIYCGRNFGSVYIKNNERKITTIEFDHVVPFSYSLSNQFILASCNLCNQEKSNKIFDSVEQAREHLRMKTQNKGIRYEDDDVDLSILPSSIYQSLQKEGLLHGYLPQQSMGEAASKD